MFTNVIQIDYACLIYIPIHLIFPRLTSVESLACFVTKQCNTIEDIGNSSIMGKEKQKPTLANNVTSLALYVNIIQSLLALSPMLYTRQISIMTVREYTITYLRFEVKAGMICQTRCV
jgi:hypothetical protein